MDNSPLGQILGKKKNTDQEGLLEGSLIVQNSLILTAVQGQT